MRLRHADRQPVDSVGVELGDLVLRRLEQEDPVGPVRADRDRLDLLLDRRVQRIELRERVRLLRSGRDGLGQCGCTRAAVRVPVVDLGGVGTTLDGEPLHELYLFGRIRREPVDRDHGVQPELAHDAQVPP